MSCLLVILHLIWFFFLRPLENHEDWPLPSPLSFLLLTKKILLWGFILVLFGILFLIFYFSQINSFYFKIKYFSQKNHFKNLFQKLIRVLKIKISFFLFKNNMQPYLVRFASFSVFNKNFGFERRHESKLVVPHKWDNSELNSCISIGELVKPLHKKIFSKIIFVAIFVTCWNYVYLF